MFLPLLATLSQWGFGQAAIVDGCELVCEKNPGCLVYIGDYTTQLYRAL